jgi:AraC-like DNA-binding protein
MASTVQVEAFLGRVARPVVALATDYADRHAIPPHHHRRHQLLNGICGVVMVTTPQGAWVMPPQHGLWIPAGVVHAVRMLGDVKMRSLYFEPDAIAGQPAHCQVVGISPFMRSLIIEAVQVPAAYDVAGRAGALMALIAHEIGRLPQLPLSLPFPAHKALARRCHGFLRRPSAHATIAAWSDALGLSRRSFTRLFRRETGLSFAAWRQQACVVAALPRLAAGEAVTTIALDLGYDNPAAFTAMFTRLLGASPRAYFARHGESAVA